MLGALLTSRRLAAAAAGATMAYLCCRNPLFEPCALLV
jgi:hypothetical protein